MARSVWIRMSSAPRRSGQTLGRIARHESAAIKIDISDEPTSEIVHRFRNLAEDIYRSLGDICCVSIEEIDSSTASLTVRDIHRRDLGDLTQTIKRELKKHHFDASATLTRL